MGPPPCRRGPLSRQSPFPTSELASENPEARHGADFDPIWARFDAADVPFVVHVAVNGHYEAVPKSFRNNRRAEAQTAADAPGSPLDFVTINNSAEIFLSAMLFDDVFDRHPKLRCVSMEHGAFWVPSWLKAIDFAGAARLPAPASGGWT